MTLVEIFKETGRIPLDLSNIDFHCREDDVIPHIALKFDKCKDNFIKEIIIGPKCKARKRDVEILLRKNGIKCKVNNSKGTYR